MGPCATTRRSVVWFLIAVATIEVSLGWLLSSLQQLTRGTYLALLVGSLLPVAFWSTRESHVRSYVLRSVRSLRSRLRRPLPLLYHLALLLSVLGGLAYLPNNYDALSYRIPRALDWVTNHGWYWIPTTNQRMNFSGSVQEWLFLPFLVALRSDRTLFLVNVVAFSVLPYLIFSVFTRLGIRSRVAWQWMWLLPLGTGVLLQAGGVGNDLLSVFFFLAAMDTALRFRGTPAPALLSFSALSIALCTGVKASNAPLTLPWLAILAPMSRQTFRGGFRLAAVGLLSLSVSILPTVVLNSIYTRSWTGDPANQSRVRLQNPIAGLAGNLALIMVDGMTPPILPFANDVEAALNGLPAFRSDSWLTRQFPRFHIALSELPQEDASSGLGMLVTILFVWSFVRGTWALGETRQPRSGGTNRRPVVLLFAATAVATLVFMTTLGSEAAARLFLPYSFVIVSCGLRLRDPSRLIRTRSWRAVSVGFAAITIGILVASPSRPLFPVALVLKPISGIAPQALLSRAQTVYETYAHRADAFAEVRKTLDEGGGHQVLGFVSSGNDPETSLWRPFGGRRVVYVLPGMTVSELKQRGVQEVLVSQKALSSMGESSRAQFSYLSSGVVLGTYVIQVFASRPKEVFTLIDISR